MNRNETIVLKRNNTQKTKKQNKKITLALKYLISKLKREILEVRPVMNKIVRVIKASEISLRNLSTTP